MKRFLQLFILLFPLVSISQNIDSVWYATNYTKKEVYIPMRDGAKLFTSIYIPNTTAEKHPILLKRTPYSCAPYGEKSYNNPYTTYYSNYLKEGYIFVTQDVRGRWMSEGEFVDVRPYNPNKKNQEIDEASDTYDTVDWLVKNIENNNGNVGAFGISYPGFYATMIAMSNHPAIKAVSPQAPVTDWFMGDDFHHNGAFFLMDGFNFYSSFGKPRPKPTTAGPKGFDFKVKDNYKFYLETGALPNFAKLMGDSIKFWNDLYKHPNLDDWWKSRNARAHVNEITTNTLVVGGLFDAEDCYGAWNLYKAIESKAKNNNKLVMGPWFHGGWGGRNDGFNLGNVEFGSKTSEWYQQNIEVPYFNFYLKGKGNIDKIAEANIFFTGENNWHQFEAWPPKNIVSKSLFLQEENRLSFITPKNTYGKSTYISDPFKPVPYTEDVHERRTREYMTDDQRFASRRPDVLTFETPILENDITLAGPLVADLFISISSTDADFVVKLIDVFPDDFQYSKNDKYPMGGYQMLVRGEIMRGKYRNSFEIPEAFIPNKITNVKYELPDVAHTFKKGHKIMVQIQSSWFPLADRNPQQFMNIYKATDKDFKKATIQIHHNKNYNSKISLPILK